MRPELSFSRSQRRGLLALGIVIAVLQLCFLAADFSRTDVMSAEGRKWLSQQRSIDSVKKAMADEKPKIYPFNPNFISDYKGYKMGMSVAELDRLFAFRKTGRYVNSGSEFQQVTQVSDSLLQKMSPYFKFPDWVGRRKKGSFPYRQNGWKAKENKPEKPIDINLATKEELMKVYGIGPALSERILKTREKFGGFVSMDQLELVWGLSPEVIAETRKKFTVLSVPQVKKTKINSATFKEMMQIPYFTYELTKETVTVRSMESGFKSVEDLTKIPGLPVEKIKIISLYLEF